MGSPSATDGGVHAGAITVPLLADTAYFVIVDGYFEAGAFTLVVDVAP